MKKGQKHSEESKALMSANRKGKAVGHAFWGSPDYFKNHAKELAEKRRKMYPIRACVNPQCENEFQVVSKDPHKKFCSLKCANQFIGKNSKLGERSKNRTPPKGSGRCKWYEYQSPIAGILNVQGTWELRFASCLDAQGKVWRTNHNKDRFTYLDEEGQEKSYSPDFFCDGIYYEVKGYLDKKAKHKIEQVQKQGIKIQVIKWRELQKWETKYFGSPLSGVNTTNKTIKKLAKN